MKERGRLRQAGKEKNISLSLLVQFFLALPQYWTHVTSLFLASLTRVLKRQATGIHQHKHDQHNINVIKVRSQQGGLRSLYVDHGGCHEQQHIHNHATDKALQYRAYAETHRPEEEASGAVFSQ